MADHEQNQPPKKDPSIKDKIKEGTDKLKEGMSMNDIEGYAKKYSTEVFMIVAIVIAVISSIFDFFISSSWGIFLAGLGALYGLLAPKQVDGLLGKMFEYASKKDKSIQIMIGIAQIIIAIFLPAVIFGMFGLIAGNTFAVRSKKS